MFDDASMARRRTMQRLFVSLSVLGVWLAVSGPSAAQTFNSGSTEANGDLLQQCSVTLPSGVYNYRTVTIPAGVTVTYTRNPANSPVTILATGSVTIAGIIDVSGTAGSVGVGATSLAPSAGIGGAGGFDGGNGTNGVLGSIGGAGRGPGGGLGAAPDGGCGGGGGGGGLANHG